MIKTLEYYFNNGSHIKFNNYTIDTSGIITNKKTGKVLKFFKNGEYTRYSVNEDNGKKRKILIGPAILSSFIGQPPAPAHTADHIDRDPNNDILENLRWSDRSGQNNNQDRPETHQSAFIIVRDGVEKTANQWVNHLKEEKTPNDRIYTAGMIIYYAQTKKNGFVYKEYPNITNEIWKKIDGSMSARGSWEISNMNRIKFITKHAENILFGNRLSQINGYPRCVLGYCHILAFKTFFPNEWANKKPGEIVKHIGDNKLDFRPHMLQLGTHSENASEAHINGCHNGKKSARIKCASYVKDILEKEYDSQSDAMRYLKSIGFKKADSKSISDAIVASRKGKIAIRYGRTWQQVI